MALITPKNIATSKLTDGSNFLQSLPAGSVLQVVSTTSAQRLTSTVQDSTFVALPGLTASITPTDANNLILVTVHVGKVSSAQGSTSTGDRQMNFRVKRDSTDIGLGETWENRLRVTFSVLDGPHHSAGRGGSSGSTQILDNPNTTSSITYSVYGSGHDGSSWAVNRAAETNNSADAPQSTTSSTITLMEIKA